MPNEIGTTYRKAYDCPNATATASTSRISSVAYAVEESASEEKTANAVFLLSLSWEACSEVSALPIKKRLIADTICSSPPLLQTSTIAVIPRFRPSPPGAPCEQQRPGRQHRGDGERRAAVSVQHL